MPSEFDTWRQLGESRLLSDGGGACIAPGSVGSSLPSAILNKATLKSHRCRSTHFGVNNSHFLMIYRRLMNIVFMHAIFAGLVRVS